MPSRSQIGQLGESGRELVLARPENLPEEWYRVWEQLVSDMSREAQALPMSTMMGLLIERIATLYVRLRMSEAAGDTPDWEMWKTFNGLWLKFHSEFATQVHRNSQTPEQRFMAGVKAALNTALRRAGPEARVRELIPVLAEEMEAYDI